MENNFGEKVEWLLTEKGGTKKSLYDFLKMTANGFDNMIKNNSLSAARLGQIADYFGVPVSHFYGTPDSIANKTVDESNFGDQVVKKLAEDISQLRHFFEEEIRVKNQQIAGLQRTVDVLVGKSKGVSKKSRIVPTPSSIIPSTDIMKRGMKPAAA